MARRSILRASDADREQVADRLRKAASEGRLLAEELEQRLGAALSARTYGELDQLVADLPEERLPARRGALEGLRGPAWALAVTLMALAVLAAVVLLITGTVVAGGAWVFFAFWLFACRGARSRARYGRARYGARAGERGWQAGRLL